MNSKKFPKSMSAKILIAIHHAIVISGVGAKEEFGFGKMYTVELNASMIEDALQCSRNTALKVLNALSEWHNADCRTINRSFVCTIKVSEERAKQAVYATRQFYPNRFTH